MYTTATRASAKQAVNGSRRLRERALAALTGFGLLLAGGVQSAQYDPPAAAAPLLQLPYTNDFTSAGGDYYIGSQILPGNWLRLTSNAPDQFGSFQTNGVLTSVDGFVIEFEYATYGGTFWQADGLAFNLSDGAAAPGIGFWGNQLGYGSWDIHPGMPGGWMSVGLAEIYGGILVQGSASTGYSDHVPATLNVNTGSREAARKVQIRLSLGAAGTPVEGNVFMTMLMNKGFNTPMEVVVDKFNVSAIPGQSPLPPTIRVGFSGSTGTGTNTHEVRLVTMRTAEFTQPKLNPTNGTTVTGTADPNSEITIFDENGAVIGTGVTDGYGKFTVDLTSEPAHESTITAVSGDGVSTPSKPAAVQVDSEAPTVPTVNPVNAGQGGTLSGTGEAGTKVLVSTASGTPIGTTTVTEQGTYTYTIPSYVAHDTILNVRLEDAAGNISEPAASRTDLIKPEPPLLDPTAGTVVNGTAEPGSTVVLRDANGTEIGRGPVNDSGDFSITLTTPAAGNTTITAVAVDAAGNTSEQSSTVVVPFPDKPVITAPTGGAVVLKNKPTITGTATPGTTVVLTDEGGKQVCTVPSVPASGTWSCDPSTAFASGNHQLTARSTNIAGQQTSDASAFVVDLTPATLEPTNGKTVRGTGPAGSTMYIFDEANEIVGSGPVAADGTYAFTLTTAQQHDTTLTAAARDTLGYYSGSATQTVDALAPRLVVEPVNDGTHVTGESEPGATVTLRDANGATLATTTASLADGSYSFALASAQPNGDVLTVVASDKLGNTSQPESTKVLLPPTAPTITATLKSGTTLTNRPVLSGTGTEGATIRVTDQTGQLLCETTVIAGAWSCTPTTSMENGQHTLRATAVNLSGTAESASFALRVNTGAPNVNPSNGQVVTGSGVPGSLIRVFDPLGAPIGTGEVLADGSYRIELSETQSNNAILRVTQEDVFGNVTQPGFSTVDTFPPLPPYLKPSNGLTVSGVAEAGTIVVISDPSGKEIGRGPTDGDGKFAIVLNTEQPHHAVLKGVTVDYASNTSEPSTVKVLRLPAPAPIVDPTNGSVIAGKADPEALLTIKTLDGAIVCETYVTVLGTFRCTPVTVPLHDTKLLVYTTDALGVKSEIAPATVDAEPPAKPVVNPTDGSVLRGTAEPGALIFVKDSNGLVVCETQTDIAGSWRCVPNRTLNNLETLSVVAIDAAGNSSEPASVEVDQNKPEPPVLTLSDGNSITGTAEPRSTVRVYSSDNAYLGSAITDAAGTFTLPLLNRLANGLNLTATATDEANNTSDAGEGRVSYPTGANTVSCVINLDHTVTCTGEAATENTITVQDANGETVCETTVTAVDGSWSCTTVGEILSKPLTVVITDQGGGSVVRTPVHPVPLEAFNVSCDQEEGGIVSCLGEATPRFSVSVASVDDQPVCDSPVDDTGNWGCSSVEEIVSSEMIVTVLDENGVPSAGVRTVATAFTSPVPSPGPKNNPQPTPTDSGQPQPPGNPADSGRSAQAANGQTAKSKSTLAVTGVTAPGSALAGMVTLLAVGLLLQQRRRVRLEQQR